MRKPINTTHCATHGVVHFVWCFAQSSWERVTWFSQPRDSDSEKKHKYLKKETKTTARSHPTTCRKRVTWKIHLSTCPLCPLSRSVFVCARPGLPVALWEHAAGTSRLVANISMIPRMMIPRMWHGTVENEASETPLPKPIES